MYKRVLSLLRLAFERERFQLPALYRWRPSRRFFFVGNIANTRFFFVAASKPRATVCFDELVVLPMLRQFFGNAESASLVRYSGWSLCSITPPSVRPKREVVRVRELGPCLAPALTA